jgi:hypothetical protein
MKVLWEVQDHYYDATDYYYFSSKKAATKWIGKHIIKREKAEPLTRDHLFSSHQSRFNHIKRLFAQKKWADIAIYYHFSLEKDVLR